MFCLNFVCTDYVMDLQRSTYLKILTGPRNNDHIIKCQVYDETQDQMHSALICNRAPFLGKIYKGKKCNGPQMNFNENADCYQYVCMKHTRLLSFNQSRMGTNTSFYIEKPIMSQCPLLVIILFKISLLVNKHRCHVLSLGLVIETILMT